MKTALIRIAIISAFLIVEGSSLWAQEIGLGYPVRAEKNRVILKLMRKEQYQQAADECKALIDSDPEFSKPYTMLVMIAGKAGQLDQTKKYFEKLSQTNPRAHYALGLIFNEQKEYQSAVEYQFKCLNAIPSFTPAAKALAAAVDKLKKTEDVEKYFLSLPTEASFAFGLGHLYALQKKYDLALEIIEKALRLEPQSIEAKLLKIYIILELGRNAEGLNLSEELLRVQSEGMDPELRIRLLKFRIYANYDFGQKIIDQTEALHLTREYGQASSEIYFLTQIGTSYLSMKNYSKALDYYQQALEISLAGGRPSLPQCLGNIGVAYDGLRNFAKAAEYYRLAIKAARETEPIDKGILINFLINLSRISSEIGQGEQARPLLEEAAQLLGSSRIPSLKYRLQASWAIYYLQIGNFGESLKFNQAALQIARDSRDLFSQGVCHYRIGDCYLSLREIGDASVAFQEALAIGRQLKAPSLIWKGEAGLAQTLHENEPENALFHYHRAIEAIEDTRLQQATHEDKTVFFLDKTDVYQQAVLLLISMHRHDPSKRYDAEAFHLAERARARSLLDSLGETTAHLEQGLEKELRDRHQEIQGRLSEAEAQLVKAAGDKKGSPDARQKLEADLLRAVDEYKEWQRQVRLRNPRHAELTFPEPIKLERLQQVLRGER